MAGRASPKPFQRFDFMDSPQDEHSGMSRVSITVVLATARSFKHLKPIPNIPNRNDVLGTMRVMFNFRPQRGDASVHAPMVHDDFIAPNPIQNLIARQRPTRPA